MRILLSCLQGFKDHKIPAYNFWRQYFVNGLCEAGHEVIEVPNVDWAEGLTYPAGEALDCWRARTWGVVEDFVRQELVRRPIHMFIGYLYPKQVDATAIRELQRRGIPCVNFFCDNVREFTKVPEEFKPFALHWVPEFEAQRMYEKAGLAYVNAPMPCWIPNRMRQLPSIETEPPTFLGSADILRRDLLGRALRSGANFVIRGRGWSRNDGHDNEASQPRSVINVLRNQIDAAFRHGLVSVARKVEARVRPLVPPPIEQSRIGEPPPDSDYLRITREATVTIGVNRVLTAKRSLHQPLLFSRLRDIEAPMLGACYLTEWTEGLECLYDLGKEIETYRTAEELVIKLTELCQNPGRRTSMRKSAQRKALSEHAVGRSIARIGAQLGWRC